MVSIDVFSIAGVVVPTGMLVVSPSGVGTDSS